MLPDNMEFFEIVALTQNKILLLHGDKRKMRKLVLRSIFLMSFGYLPVLSMYKIMLYMTSLLFHSHNLVFSSICYL